MPATPPHSSEVDVLIVGGGIAGLWTLARLRAAGYSCLLVERGALGGGQTIASQGIIHGGLKYSLSGEAGEAARAIAEMPGVWRQCLRGEGEVDLRGVRVLSDHQNLWTTPGLVSRIAALGASKVLRTRVERVDERVGVFTGAPWGVDLYQVDEPVLDARSIVESIAKTAPGCIAKAEVVGLNVFTGPMGMRPVGVMLRCEGDRLVEVRAGFVVLAAGGGNGSLVEMMGDEAQWLAGRSQTRPLHMAMVRGAPGPLFGHCLGGSSLPRLTVTSGRLDDEWVWYVGGQFAEEGVGLTDEAQASVLRAELRACLPWIEWSEVKVASLRVDRHEGVHLDERGKGKRPDGPAVERRGRVLVGWPTKLALAPVFAGWVLGNADRAGVAVSGGNDRRPADELGLVSPPVAARPWEGAQVQWN